MDNEGNGRIRLESQFWFSFSLSLHDLTSPKTIDWPDSRCYPENDDS